jgi:hypothetical protein
MFLAKFILKALSCLRRYLNDLFIVPSVGKECPLEEWNCHACFIKAVYARATSTNITHNLSFSANASMISANRPDMTGL